MSSLRIPYYSLSPAVYQAMGAAGTALDDSPLGKSLVHLLYLRVSQINGCAFCVDKHARDLFKAGEDFQRINSLVTWRETDFYSPRERAALAWAEAATRLADGEVPDPVFRPLQELFSEREIADIGFATALMNAWNRMAIGFRQPVARAAFP
ncbi:carboxymuconolactone decarboxylase family protein [Massilia sp. 9I]|uniref:carboxymuconolactone decarboxylase family protein n=1 Tax=Massilia sp. 9I TaxID=2653152 RepID=UPI0012F315DD|nr:carboxymuconolactone decarboxylase family protein [Massilia sp. 9I]VXC08735.1 Alkyl hydroperoxide reductase AhpD [Massilia sp. 9I]